MATGELVMFENFTLFDAMSAVQVWTLTLYMSAMLREIHP